MSEKRKPREREMIAHALELLKSGTLPTALPGELMAKFSISAEKAQAVAVEAVNRFKKDTKPIEKPGD